MSYYDSFYVIFISVWYVLRLVLVGAAGAYLISFLLKIFKK
jgi:hypothetical protein